MRDFNDTASELSHNRLLAALPENERSLIADQLTRVPLGHRQVLYAANAPIDCVYFIVNGVVSILSVMTDGSGVETATIGREGMVGMPAFHGVWSTPEQTMVQVPGVAYRLEVDTFRDLLPHLPALEALLHRFSVVLFTLAAQNSGCNRKHSIESRCARWLLMAADRLDVSTLELTHDFVAQMLGVRRASITESLGHLEKLGFVRTGRGRISIVDRVGLQSVACECYTVIRDVVQELLESTAAQAAA